MSLTVIVQVPSLIKATTKHHGLTSLRSEPAALQLCLAVFQVLVLIDTKHLHACEKANY